MQNNRFIHAIFFIMIFALIGCQQNKENPPLPTAIDLSIQATNDASLTQTAMENLPTATLRSGLPTLPPTYTPTSQPTPTREEPTITPTPTPSGYSVSGFIYYIFNSNSIMKLAADGSSETPIFTIPVGQTISDLVLSPDQSLLAYVAPGNGSAKEVYVINLDGSYRQQVSCLGLGMVSSPAWSPDSARIAFYAAQSPGMPPAVYSAGWEGSGNCPVDNNQRQITTTQSPVTGGLAYGFDGSFLFLADIEIYALDIQSETLSPALTSNLGFGPDSSFHINPADGTQLGYVRANSNSTQQMQLGELVVINISQRNGLAQVVREFNASIYDFQWSSDGEQVVTSGANNVTLINPVTLNSLEIATETIKQPDAIFSPDDSQVAYIDSNSALPTIPQIFVANSDGTGDPVQITNYVDGSISDLNWVGATSE